MITGYGNCQFYGSGVVKYVNTSSSGSGGAGGVSTVDDPTLVRFYQFNAEDISQNKLAGYVNGVRTYDASLGFTPTISTTNSFATGRPYISFNASSSLTPITLPGLQFNQVCTVCFWMKSNRTFTGTGQSTVVSMITTTGGAQGYSFTPSNTNSGNNNILNPFINGWQYNETFSGTFNCNDNTWHHYALVVNKGSGDVVYIDGNYYNVASRSGYSYVQYAPLYNIFLNKFILGAAYWETVSHFVGSLGDFRFYTKELLPIEISNLYTYGTIKPATSFTTPVLTNTTFLSQQVFTYTGANQTLTIPATATHMIVSAWGAGGASATTTSLHGAGWGTCMLYCVGGAGGFTQAIFPVNPANQSNYNVIVGGGGISTLSTITVPGSFGGGGGDSAGSGVWPVTTGGGRSAIQYSSNDIITAGGGGGGGAQFNSANNYRLNGGVGGGLVGGNADQDPTNYVAGFGGTQIAGGSSQQNAGSKYTGGSNSGVGGTGGGGYYGGGAGAYAGNGNSGFYFGGGGGGSSYIDTTALNVSSITTMQQASKAIPANVAGIPASYVNTVGYGGAEGGTSGGNGLVVVTYLNAVTNITSLYSDPLPAGKTMHLDAARSWTISFNSDKSVSGWNDLAGNYNFTTIGGGNGYKMTYDSVNQRIVTPDYFSQFGSASLSTVNSSSSAFLQCVLSSSIPLTTGGTFYCVVQVKPGTTNYNGGPVTISSETSSGGCLYGFGDGSTMYLNALGNSRAGAITITPPNGGQNFYNKCIFKITVTTSNVFTYQYITSTNNVSQTYGGGTRGIANAMFIGAGGKFVSNQYFFNSFDGYFHEIIFYNTLLSSANQTTVENYLINKWSL